MRTFFLCVFIAVLNRNHVVWAADLWKASPTTQDKIEALKNPSHSVSDKLDLLRTLAIMGGDRAIAEALFESENPELIAAAVHTWILIGRKIQQFEAPSSKNPKVYEAFLLDPETIQSFPSTKSLKEAVLKIALNPERSEDARARAVQLFFAKSQNSGIDTSAEIAGLKGIALDEKTPARIRGEALRVWAAQQPKNTEVQQVIKAGLDTTPTDRDSALKLRSAVFASASLGEDAPDIREKAKAAVEHYEKLFKTKGVPIGTHKMGLVRALGPELTESLFQSRDKADDFRKVIRTTLIGSERNFRHPVLSLRPDDLPVLLFAIPSGELEPDSSQILNQIDPDILSGAIKNENPEVQNQARQLAKRFLQTQNNQRPARRQQVQIALGIPPASKAVETTLTIEQALKKAILEDAVGKVTELLSQWIPQDEKKSTSLWTEAANFVLKHPGPNLEDTFLTAVEKRKPAVEAVSATCLAIFENSSPGEKKQRAAKISLKIGPARAAPFNTLAETFSGNKTVNLLLELQKENELGKVDWKRIVDTQILNTTPEKRQVFLNRLNQFRLPLLHGIVTGLLPLLAQEDTSKLGDIPNEIIASLGKPDQSLKAKKTTRNRPTEIEDALATLTTDPKSALSLLNNLRLTHQERKQLSPRIVAIAKEIPDLNDREAILSFFAPKTVTDDSPLEEKTAHAAWKKCKDAVAQLKKKSK